MTPGCYPCAPGSVAPSNFSTGGINHVNFHLNGQGFSSREYVVGNSVSIFGPTFVVAESVTLPFTFTGFISYYEGNSAVLTEHTLIGRGFVTIEHQFFSSPDGQRFFQFRSATYNFAPDPVPEPATLTLLAAGLAGGAARCRRKSLRDG